MRLPHEGPDRLELREVLSAASVDAGVSEAEYHRLLGYPRDHVPGDQALELARAARQWFAAHGRPWLYVRETELTIGRDSLQFGGVEFVSPRLHGHLRRWGARQAMLVAVSAGPECEEHARALWQDSRPDEYFFLEILGSAVVEHLTAAANHRLCERADAAGLLAMPHYSPGFAGWDVAEQNKLFDLITRGGAAVLPGPLEVLPSGMLRPKKAQLAVVGLAPRTPENLQAVGHGPCERCGWAHCAYRRAPARASGLAPTEVQLAAGGRATAPRPAYSINLRALEKWARERVVLSPQADGSVEAVFRFDGTTCSNLGQPLAFDYRLKLSGPAGPRVILAADCAPAPGDEGSRSMCAYLNDAEQLLRAIAQEKPPLGQLLEDALGAPRSPEAAGCHCTAASRAHHWAVALEAVHFALHHAPLVGGPPPPAVTISP